MIHSPLQAKLVDAVATRSRVETRIPGKRFEPTIIYLRSILIIAALAVAASALAFGRGSQTASPPDPPEHISFPTQDGGIVHADLYGKGARGVVLAHGGRFTRESWEKQARTLVKAGFRVLAIDFRGRGQSHGPAQPQSADNGLRFDVLAAVRYLRQNGAKSVSIIGASFGGGAAGEATIEAKPGEIDGLVLLAHSPIDKPELMKGRKLFIVTREDANTAGLRLPGIQKQYERTPGPKKLVILDGPAHAQFIFETDQGDRLMGEILAFLTRR